MCGPSNVEELIFGLQNSIFVNEIFENYLVSQLINILNKFTRQNYSKCFIKWDTCLQVQVHFDMIWLLCHERFVLLQSLNGRLKCWEYFYSLCSQSLITELAISCCFCYSNIAWYVGRFDELQILTLFEFGCRPCHTFMTNCLYCFECRC